MNKSQRNAVGLLGWEDVAQALDEHERKLSSLTSQNATLRRRLSELEQAAVPKPQKRRFRR